jgi:hypothetical protein
MAINNGLILFSSHFKEFNEELIELLDVENELSFNKVDVNLDKLPVGIISGLDFAELELFINFIE